VVAAIGKGDGTFTSSWSWEGNPFVLMPSVVDLNNDGKVDLVGADSRGPEFWTFLCNGDGTFQPVGPFFDPNAVSHYLGLAVGDFNGDTLPDVAVVSDANITGIFMNTTPTFTLTLTLAGSGVGTVISQPAVMNCKNSCIGNFAPGTTVTLTAVPDAVSNFTGWSGACSGTGTCSVTLNAAANVTATLTLQDFSLSPASAKLTLQPGAQGTDVITLAGLNGPFASAIQLTCTITGSAPKPTCSLSATSVTPAASSVTSTLTITTPASAAATQAPLSHRQSKLVYALLLPFMFGVTLVAGSKKQRRRYGVPCGLLLLLILLQTACGGGSSRTSVVQQPTNYMVTVTGVSGTITHTTQVTVTVQ
jgi:hypothetical protein